MTASDLRDRFPRQAKLRGLRALVVVAEQGSFRKAARLLHLTQPAVTAAIADLEQTLGVRLFERTSRGVTLTPYGDSLVTRANAVLGELGRAADDIEIISRGSRQTLRIGTGGGGWGLGILPAALARLLDSKVEPFILVREADEDVLLDLLKARQLDLFFSRLTPLAADPDLDYRPLFEDSMCVLASRTHRLAGRRNLTWNALADEKWVTPQSGTLSFDHIQRTLHKSGLTMPRHVIESASAPVALGMALQTDFLCFGTFHFYAHSTLKKLLTVLDVDLPKVTVRFGTVMLKDREQHPLGVRLARIVAELARASRGGPRA